MIGGPPDEPGVTTPEPAKVTRLPVRFKEPPDEDRTLLGPYEPPHHPDCQHLFVQYWVSPSEAEVTCGKCGTKLNPMWVLGQLATSDRRYAEQQKAAKAAQARLDERRRAKCQHCGKMTRVKL
jgi:hypothetical protein